MFRLIRYFTIASLVGMVVITTTLGFYYRQTVINHNIQHKVDENTALAIMLAVNMWKDYAKYAAANQNLNSQELLLHPEVQEFSREVQDRAGKFKLLQLNIYALNGQRIFSTNLQAVGENAGTLSGFNKAVAGITSSKLLHQDPMNFQSQTTAGRDIIINFLPLYSEDSAKVRAVAEVHSDLTNAVVGINRNQYETYVVIAANLGALIIMLMMIVRRAARHMKDNTEHIEAQQQLIEFQTYHDSLTGLPNLKYFRNSLEQAMELAERRESLLAVLAINLFRLKHVNDTFGYTIGDGLLLEVMERLQKCLRNHDTLARTSGDEFYVMLEPITVVYEVEEIAAQIIQEFSLPAIVDGQELFVTPSIGIVIFPFEDNDDVEALIKKANTAMYQSNEVGRNAYRFYDNTMPLQIASRFSMESALRRAIEREEFELHYQPVVLLKTGKIIAVEALLRWRSPEMGLISPLEFVPLLEETGLIMPVGNWVLETACAQTVAWQDQGIKDLKINVNVSAVQFSQKGIAAQVRSALDQSGLLPHLLDLEITESLLIDDINNAMQILDVLNDMGISLSIDDFGTGYSSLAYLKRMPIGTLKIDRSFVCDLNADADDAAIVDAVCAMAGSLRFKVTAEGVENQEQLNILREMGVDAVQGYFFSRPLPLDEITRLLQQNSIMDFVA